MTKFTDIKYIDGFDSWFEMWYTDKKSVIATMYRNMQADIDAGYNPIGNIIKNQLADIVVYQKSIDEIIDHFTTLNDDSKIERYCYHDLLKNGVIE